MHVDSAPAEVDEHYIVACGVLGDIGASLEGIVALAPAAAALSGRRPVAGDHERIVPVRQR